MTQQVTPPPRRGIAFDEDDANPHQSGPLQQQSQPTARADTTPPTIITLSPSNEAAGVAVNAEFSITFDEDVVAGANPHISIYQADFEEAVFESNEGNFSGSTATFKLTSDLSPNTSYYVLIDSTAIEDLAGNSFGGIADASVWTFTTASDTASDTTPPTIITLSPSNEAAGVAVNAEFSITFDEDVVAGANPHISIYQADFEEAVFESNEGNFSGSTATFKLTSDLSPNTSYYVLIDSTAIEDLAGNSFGGIADASVWTFTTASDTAGDTTPPTIITLSPSNEAAGVAVNAEFSITFDEDVVAGANPHISIYQADFEEAVFESNEGNFSGSTATFKLTSDLGPNTSYYVLIDSTAIEDLAGNSFGGIANTNDWTFTTASDSDSGSGNDSDSGSGSDSGDTQAPEMSAMSPNASDEDVALDVELSLTFTEAVQAGSGTIDLFAKPDDRLIEAIDVTSEAVTFADATVKIRLTSALAYATHYYVQIDAAAFTDTAPAQNAFAGISDTTTWTFTTKPETILADAEGLALVNTSQLIANTMAATPLTAVSSALLEPNAVGAKGDLDYGRLYITSARQSDTGLPLVNWLTFGIVDSKITSSVQGDGVLAYVSAGIETRKTNESVAGVLYGAETSSWTYADEPDVDRIGLSVGYYSGEMQEDLIRSGSAILTLSNNDFESESGATGSTTSTRLVLNGELKGTQSLGEDVHITPFVNLFLAHEDMNAFTYSDGTRVSNSSTKLGSYDIGLEYQGQAEGWGRYTVRGALGQTFGSDDITLSDGTLYSPNTDVAGSVTFGWDPLQSDDSQLYLEITIEGIGTSETETLRVDGYWDKPF